MKKKIIDVCCGSRMFRFNKKHPDAIYTDNREVDDVLCDGRRLTIGPDVVMDFRNIEYPDNSFHLVIFDPPHLTTLGQTSRMAKKYGVLGDDWRDMIRQGFSECMRICKPNGTIVFKRNETDITVSEILKVIGHEPLIGHKSGKRQNTHRMLFMKSD